MKKILLLSVIALFLMSFTGCFKQDGDSANASEVSAKSDSKKLYLFNWTYYTPDSVINKFEKEFGVDVVYDSYPSNEEMFAKLRGGGADYDIVIPSGDYVSIMMELGMLSEIDLSKIPNVSNISDLVLSKATYDPEMKYSVPYYMGAAGIAVNKTKLKDYEKSWNIFADKSLAGHMVMLDDMREVLGDALAHLGYSVNTKNPAELAQAKDLINNEWKPNLVKFDAESFAKGFSQGEFWVAQGYSEAFYEELKKQPGKWEEMVDFFIPEEGGPMYIDSMCILKDAKNKDLAHEFINFIHRPEIYAEFLDYFKFCPGVNPNAQEFMAQIPAYSAEQMGNCETKDNLGQDLRLYTDIWQEIRVE